MSRPVRVLISIAPVLVATGVAACGTQKIQVPSSDPNHAGAVLFSQRCSGCHTLAAAATHGSASNVRTREITNGPNFNVRCERPVTRVLYAIENGGFSGAIMPQNIVVGQDAINVAKFVATYAGRQAANLPGSVPCQAQPIGTLPAPGSSTTGTTATSTATTPTATAAHGGKSGAQSATKSTKKRP